MRVGKQKLVISRLSGKAERPLKAILSQNK